VATRTLVIIGAAVALLAALVIGLALFQPWKLWVDDTVDQAAPAGAAPVTLPVETTVATVATTATTLAPTTVPSTTPATIAPTTLAPATTVPIPAPLPVMFVSLDHGTSGRLVLLEGEGGQRFVRFEDLDTSNGPDLKVYLSTNPVDGPEQAFDDDYLDLGRLQGNIGSQNYELPSDADLTRFRSVVIWCDRFNSAFGAAPLA
jgi:Electron transfer DM13